MKPFKNDKVYCLHNVGVNYDPIFFSERNKSYFTSKIKKFLLPFAEVIQTTLLDNQFFIVIKTHKEKDLELLNRNIGIMIGSYARGVNKEQDRIGHLFAGATKAIDEIAKFPKHILDQITNFRIFIQESRLVDFAESISSFFYEIKTSFQQNNPKLIHKNLIKVFQHPKFTRKKAPNIFT